MHKKVQVPFEQYLLDSPLSALFIEIKEYSLNSLHLIMYGTNNYVGFGKTKDFCMYFIGLHNNMIIFSSRIKYVNSIDKTNIVRLPFIEVNRTKIFDYIRIINNNAKKNGNVDLTKRVVKLYDNVLIQLDGVNERIYIGENYLDWHPVWTSKRGSGKRTAYKSETILGGDPTKGFVSSQAPLAKAILGKPEGTTFTYTVNGARINGVILKITSTKN